MISFLKNLFSGKTDETLQQYLDGGAVVIDVRSEGEFGSGHVKDSKNIPLNKLANRLDSIKKMNRQVVCVCASGMRSSQATNFLKQNGVDAINGGSWNQVRSLLNKK